MSKPPKAPPHSDIDGIHEDEGRNTDVAADLGESAEQLERAGREDVARPDYSDGSSSLDNRTE